MGTARPDEADRNGPGVHYAPLAPISRDDPKHLVLRHTEQRPDADEPLAADGADTDVSGHVVGELRAVQSKSAGDGRLLAREAEMEKPLELTGEQHAHTHLW